jgi:hypothetical protein
VQIFSSDHLKQKLKGNRLHCSKCHQRKYEREAGVMGQILLGDAENKINHPNYKNYQFKGGAWSGCFLF